ncbi:sensor histidine kinase [Bacillus horti]|uniref:histidine kinase n=1 Tax=Caldalkalibacillus horti TaxID=77523 RepID=A0ABT9VZI2_9BACI|nr:histidine kinase [Bacillus horti]MDQ0166020.1 signal transduction histidine kinase [Bacillus horti]
MNNVRPETSMTIARLAGLLLLGLHWFISNGEVAGFLLLLILTIISIGRWRFNWHHWTILLDQLACFICVVYWPEAWYAFAIPVFEVFKAGKLIFLAPLLFILTYEAPITLLLLAILTFAGLLGWVIRCWHVQLTQLRTESDNQRREHYELQSYKEELLTANVEAARLAEITERQRISQKLHDHVGHEITGAVLALQAFEQLWKENDPQATEMFSQVKQRVTNSATQLRDTVHNMNPVRAFGIHRLDELCSRFKACPVEMKVYGDFQLIEAHQWNILETCLKEALTNIIRHSAPKRVEVTLDVSTHIVRLSIFNDGVNIEKASQSFGMGLRNLRQRAQFAGGSVTTDAKDGFRVICVLPMGKETLG